MGKRGPAKTPTPVLAKRGSHRAKSRAKVEPPVIPVEDESKMLPPPYLRHDAIIIWNRLVPLLQRMKVLSESDFLIVALFCETHAKWREAEDFLVNNGDAYCVANREGEECWRRYPQSSAAKEYVDQLCRLGGKLGLSPADRASLVSGDTSMTTLNANKARHFQTFDSNGKLANK
jgi:P27 family predicted phage terminase small subunit